MIPQEANGEGEGDEDEGEALNQVNPTKVPNNPELDEPQREVVE